MIRFALFLSSIIPNSADTVGTIGEISGTPSSKVTCNCAVAVLTIC